MHRSPTNSFYPLILIALGTTTPLCAQTPAPQIGQVFSLPLSTSQSGQAVILPKADGNLLLVYATPAGRLGFWTMTQQTPTPPPSPDPPPQPPQKTALAVVVSDLGPWKPSAAIAAELTKRKLSLYAWDLAVVAEPNPPADALLWIGRTAGKPYPYLFLAAADGTILWQGPLPRTDAALLELLDTNTTPHRPPRQCRGGRCPLTESPAQ